MLGSVERSEALVLALMRASTPTETIRLFLEWGNMCDAPWWNRTHIVDSLRPALRDVALADFLEPRARAFYDALPAAIPIWRGCERGRERGLHWTTDRLIAEGFARGKRCFNKCPTLVSAIVPKRHVFAVFVDRDENEVASKYDCEACRLKPRCCPKEPARYVPRSIYEGARDMARQIASSWEGRTARRLRKKVEMLFAHLKRTLKLDRLRLRGPNGARDEFLLADGCSPARLNDPKFGELAGFGINLYRSKQGVGLAHNTRDWPEGFGTLDLKEAKALLDELHA
jgi:hypothetical protein